MLTRWLALMAVPSQAHAVLIYSEDTTVMSSPHLNASFALSAAYQGPVFMCSRFVLANSSCACLRGSAVAIPSRAEGQLTAFSTW